MKKRLMAFMAAGLCALALTGCASGEPAGSGASGDAALQTEAAETDAGESSLDISAALDRADDPDIVPDAILVFGYGNIRNWTKQDWEEADGEVKRQAAGAYAAEVSGGDDDDFLAIICSPEFQDGRPAMLEAVSAIDAAFAEHPDATMEDIVAPVRQEPQEEEEEYIAADELPEGVFYGAVDDDGNPVSQSAE